MLRIKNKNMEIKNDVVNGNVDVLVTDGKKEYYRANKTPQTISIANDIYLANKYNEV